MNVFHHFSELKKSFVSEKEVICGVHLDRDPANYDEAAFLQVLSQGHAALTAQDTF